MNNETLDRGEPADPIEAIQAETAELQADLRRLEDAAEERRLDHERRMAELRARTAAAEAKAASLELEYRRSQAASCGIDYDALTPGERVKFAVLYDQHCSTHGNDPIVAGFLDALDGSLLVREGAVKSGRSEQEAREASRKHLASKAPCGYDEFKRRSRTNELAFARAHFPARSTSSRSQQRGREGRPASNSRTRGSRRSASTTSGGGRSDDPDLPDQPDDKGRPVNGRSAAEHPLAPDDSAGPGSPLPEHGSPGTPLRRVTNCRACGELIDPSRRSDAEFCPGSTCRMARKKMDADAPPAWTDAQRIAALQKQRAKILRAAPAADLPEATSNTTFGDKQCRDEDRHPDHIAEVSARVRAADSPREAAEILKSWLARCFHDRRYGDLTCRNCGRTVAERDFRPTPFRITFNGDAEDLWLEMTTDGDGQSLYPSASSGRAFG